MLSLRIQSVFFIMLFLALFLLNTGHTDADLFAERIVNNNHFSATTLSFSQRHTANNSYIDQLFRTINIQPEGFDLGAVRIKKDGKLIGYIEKEKYDDFNKRLNDLDSLIHIASRYKSLEQFLSDMALEPPERSIIGAGPKDNDDSALTLSTIHSAKGLEWHTVFLIYVAEGHLPSYLSLENEEDIEEERRLFYVAATRAKDNLVLLKPHIDRSPRSFLDDGGSVFTQVSRFLDEGDILGKLIDIESPSGCDGFKEAGDREFLNMLDEHFKEKND